MCGIFGYLGNKEALNILLDGLRSLEYRGYDSAGVAILNGSVTVLKTIGHVQCLVDKTKGEQFHGHLGIAHTRWATHGKVSEDNAHPHCSSSGRFVLVHNGIVENYAETGSFLRTKGYVFKGETDSEVLVNYIDYLVIFQGLTVKTALKKVMKVLLGAYAFVLMDEQEPGKIFAVRQMSPLVAGFSEGEVFLSSDTHALSKYAKRYFIMDNKSILVISGNAEPLLMNSDGVPLQVEYKELSNDSPGAGLEGYAHYMYKEIIEQPEIISGILKSGKDNFPKELSSFFRGSSHFNRIIILACGTSYHAGLVGKYLLEKYLRIPVSVEYAAEFRYRCPVVSPSDLVIGISQSGETADTLAAIRLAKGKGAFILSLCNVAESGMARESDATILLRAGTEIGVASTKSFTAQMVNLIQLTACIPFRDFPEFKTEELIDGLKSIPSKIKTIISREPHLIELAKKYSHHKHFLFLGRGFNYPIALEGALKLKEISYIHAEGYPASEMKHGPIALIDENFPVVAIACDAENRRKMISNIMEIKARGGIVIALIREGDTEITNIADEIIEIPPVQDALVPLLSVVPLQLFAYHIALSLGRDVDQPRNLAKSVTVE